MFQQLYAVPPIKNLKDYYAYSTIPIVEYLKLVTFCHKSVSEEKELARLRRAYQKLWNFNDKLIFLLLENCAINSLVHKQKTILEDIEVQVNQPNRMALHAGRFNKIRRQIAIIKMPHDNYASILLHEITHAVIGYAFSFDPLPAIHRLAIFTTEETRQEIFNKTIQECIGAPNLPHPAYEKFSRYKDKFPFNIAALKFKQCVVRDLQHYQPLLPNFMADPYELEIDHFINSLRLSITDQGLTNECLGEVLPLYMQCRLALLKLAKIQHKAVQEIDRILSAKIPYIHGYCETDFKKVLTHRLQYYAHHLHSNLIASIYLLTFEKPSTSSLTLSFCEDGSLSWQRSRGSYKRLSEFSCAMFALKTSAKHYAKAVNIEQADSKSATDQPSSLTRPAP